MSDSFEWRAVVRDSELPAQAAKPSKTCKKCGQPGHRQKTCGRPAPEPLRDLRCGNCGDLGHNRMTCSNPHNPEHVPERYRSQHSGRTRCSRCGSNDHNVKRCTQSEI